MGNEHSLAEQSRKEQIRRKERRAAQKGEERLMQCRCSAAQLTIELIQKGREK